MLDGHCMVRHVANHVAVDCGAPVDHNFELETALVTLSHIQVFEQAEHKARHKVKTQDAIELLLRL